jgi:3-methyladenine DNA glycosylase AlkD
MQAYMKSTMPFHGVSAARMRAVCKAAFAERTIDDAASWQRDVLALWRGARFREERYAAIELTRERRARPFQTLAALPMYEAMIVEGAWWDLVDGLATHGLFALLRNEPAEMNKAMRAWSVDDDLWKRRSAILCQIPAKGETDRSLLYACIEPSLGRPEFFLRKAIGWALRQYAWTDPAEVVRWVEVNRARLAPLSVREALKNGDGARGARSAERAEATSSPAHAARRRTGAGDPRTPRRARRPPPGSGG